MTRALCLHLPFFLTERALRERGDRPGPFALTAERGGRIVIAEADPKAARVGVEPGLTLADARAICAELLAEERAYEDEVEALEELAAWSGAFGPRVGTYGERALIVFTGGAEAALGGEDRILGDALRDLRDLGYSARAAIASNPAAAEAIAAHHPRADLAAGPDEAALIDALPAAALRLSGPDIELLEELGLTRLGLIRALPRADLNLRIPELIPRLRALDGDDDDPCYRSVTRPAPLFEALDFDGPIIDREALSRALELLIERLLVRLRRRPGGAGIRRLGLVLDEEAFDFSWRRPVVRASELVSLIDEGLERESRRRCGIERLEMEVLEAADPRRRPLELFSSRGAMQDRLEDLVERLQARLGPERVCRAWLCDDHRPERRAELRPFFEEREEPAGDEGDDDRPLRLHPAPRPIRVRSCEGLIEAVERGGRRFEARGYGPERLELGFWDAPIARDYYAVALEDGVWLWVFRDLEGGGWFEHGLFD